MGRDWRQPWTVAEESNSPLGRPLAKLAERGLESLFLGWVTALDPDSGLESVLNPESWTDPKSSGLVIGPVRFGQTLCSSS